MIDLYFDGACEPVNPGGTAAWGYWLAEHDKKIAEGSGIVDSGEGMTNNVAEYHGLIEGLKKAEELGVKGKIRIRGDSNLVISMAGKKWGWNRKKTKWIPHDDLPHLKVLLDEALALLAKRDYELEWVPRGKNREADRLSKEPLIKQGIIAPDPDIRMCPNCGDALHRRKGRYGEFYGCRNYPKCVYTEKI